MTFIVKVEGKGVVDALKNFPVAYAKQSRIALEQIGDGILANIKRRRIWAKETKGTLKEGLWSGPVQSRRGDSELPMGWAGKGAAFGPGHEYGFSKARWMVKPKNIRQDMMVSGRRIGQPIKALRFMVGGKVCYSKGHMVSAPRVLKPHFVPAYNAYPVAERMGEALDIAIKQVGLSESEASGISVGSIGMVRSR